jgi:hypothetical protein
MRHQIVQASSKKGSTKGENGVREKEEAQVERRLEQR